MDGLKLTTSDISNYLHLTNDVFVTWTNLKKLDLTSVLQLKLSVTLQAYYYQPTYSVPQSPILYRLQ